MISRGVLPHGAVRRDFFRATTCRSGYTADVIQSAPDSNWDGAAIGTATLAGLPVAAHARYELLDLPGYKRDIRDLINQAVASGSLYTTPSKDGYRNWRNPLQRKMQVGDTILQSHAGFSVRDMIRDKSPDFTTLSTGASGSPFAHAAVSTRTGRAIDPGKSELVAYADGAIGKLGDWFNNLRKGELPNFESDWQELARMRKKHGRPEGTRRFLMRHGTDAFESNIDRPNASIVLRNDRSKSVDPRIIENAIADVKSVGYSKTGASIAGLLRMLLPFRLPHAARGPAGVDFGTFCSHGACSALGAMGNKVPNYYSVLPPDLLKAEGQRLVGIGLNRTAMDSVKHLKGLSRMERMGEAARKTMTDTLRGAASTRRTFAATLIGLLAATGAAAGAGVDAGISSDKAK